MNRLSLALALTALGVAQLGAAPASAANFTLSLTGDPTAVSHSFQVIGATRYDEYYLALSGLDGTNAFTVAQGDTISEGVSFSSLFTVPASQNFTFFGLFLTGSTFPTENTGVDGTTNFYDGATLVRQGATGTTSSKQLVNATVEGPPFNTAWTFDSLTSQWTITTLGTPALLDRAFISYTLTSNAVPEPASWALMITGFGLIGAALRRRSAATAA